MFDTVGGLPVHPLTVHAVVVLLPLAALLTIAIALRPSWRRHARLLVLFNALVALAAVVAKQSGEKLLARVTQISPASDTLNTHTQWGSRLVLLAVALVVMALLITISSWVPALGRVVAVAAVLVAVGTLALTVVVGDTGAQTVWKSIITNTKG